MTNPLDRRQKLLQNNARGSFQYFLKVPHGHCACYSHSQRD